MVQVREARADDEDALVEMIAFFRVELARLRDEETQPNWNAAREELAEYKAKRFPIFVAEWEGRVVGYLVCRVDGEVVWAESLYVRPAFRRKGIGSALYAMAEKLCQELGNDTVYNWVHPNNDVAIAFLAKRGYTMLNLIELRRPWPEETPTSKIRVGKHVFDY